MKVIFSFDDGRADAINAAKILTKYGLKGTFHITTGFIDKSFLTKDFGEDTKPLTKKDIEWILDNGMEISSHGDKHIMSIEDFNCSFEKICGYYSTKKKPNTIGFSVPNSKYTQKELDSFVEGTKHKLSYVRVGRSPRCYDFIGKIQYVLYSITHLQSFYNSFNKNNLLIDINKNLLFSVVVKKNDRAKTIINFIKKYSNKNCVAIFMLHSVVETPRNVWEYSIHEFEQIACYIKSENISCLTLEELSRTYEI